MVGGSGRNRKKKIYNKKQSKTHIVKVSGGAINPDNSASEAEMIAAVAGSKWSASKGNNWPRGYNGSVTPGKRVRDCDPLTSVYMWRVLVWGCS